MANPVTTDKWAGNFDCDFCRRKRLMGDAFSKKALERYRKTGGKLKCKQCVAGAEEAERQVAAARRANDSHEADLETRTCAACAKELAMTAYNRNQWNKGDGKSKCRECVEKALADEQTQQTQFKEAQLEAARTKVQDAKQSGNAALILQAESELAALEAHKVTGLKPVKLGRGGGRRSAGRGRGRSGR